jgi:LPXTG-motif cell wall-anchored protein
MAATSASRSWAAFARRAVATGAVAAAGLIALAIPASAHTPHVNTGCEGETTTLTVDLTQYAPNEKTPNTVKVVEGKNNVLADTTFGGSYNKVFKFEDGNGHDFVVTVHAWDDQKFSFEKKLSAPACKKTTTPTKPTSPTSSPTTVPPPVTTTTEAPAVGANANLASTGASIGLPIAIGALLLVGGGVLLLVMRKRGKA